MLQGAGVRQLLVWVARWNAEFGEHGENLPSVKAT